MNPDVRAILEKVKDTADFGYVPFEDINDTNELGDNALHCVVVWGDVEAAKVLIENGININQRGEEGYTPLHLACEHGNEAMVRLLLENGADQSLRTEGDLPFTVARLRGNDAVCQLLRENAGSMKTPNGARRSAHLDRLAKGIAELEAMIDQTCPKTSSEQTSNKQPSAPDG